LFEVFLKVRAVTKVMRVLNDRGTQAWCLAKSAEATCIREACQSVPVRRGTDQVSRNKSPTSPVFFREFAEIPRAGNRAMSKVMLATFITATGNADALDDLAHEVAGTSPSPTGTIITNTGYSANELAPDENKQSVDFAARLRAAFQEEPKEALISRADAMGAAAEIEQLWAALRIVGLHGHYRT
jgi:hypothetical protein